MRSVQGDLRDYSALEKAGNEARPEFVFHLAAEAIVRRAYASPLETFATNAMGTVHLMEFLRKSNHTRAAVIATTDKVYENNGEGRAFNESDRLGGREPYGASKAMAELAFHAYRMSYLQDDTVQACTVRAGNVIGGGDFAMDRIIPDLVAAAQAGREAVVRNPVAVRPWQHVLDALQGYLQLGGRLEKSQAEHHAYNFAPQVEGAGLPVGQLAQMFYKTLGRGSLRMEGDAQGPWEAPTLQLDSARAAGELGWKAAYDGPQAVQASAQWYRHWLEGEDPRDLVLQDIRNNPKLGKNA
jgi:CDP-glucose 4,6-dehydratase